MMDAVSLIEQDHRHVEDLFKQFETAGPQAYKTKDDLVLQITQELQAHATIEEEVFYPAVAAMAAEDGKELVQEAVEEHQQVKQLLAELGQMTAEDDGFDDKVWTLIDNVRHHVERKSPRCSPRRSRSSAGTGSASSGSGWLIVRSSSARPSPPLPTAMPGSPRLRSRRPR
jgi:hemerythrin superfamily protein